MKNAFLSTKVILMATALVAIAFVAVGYQSVQAMFKKAAAEGRAIRVSEVNSCPTEATTDTAHFSGCNSIL